jgi:heptosyltransferase-3
MYHHLIIRPGAIGDTLLTFPVLHQLRARIPDSHITFISNANVLPLALACGIADEVHDYQAGRWTRLFVPNSQKCAHDEIIQRSKRAICWLRDPEGIVQRNLRNSNRTTDITIAPGRPAPDEKIHIVEYLARTARLPWTLANDGPRTRLRIADIPEYPDSSQANRIAIHPGSGGPQKCWPLERFVAVIHALWQRNLPVLLLAGPAEHERLHALRTQLGKPPHPDLLAWQINAPLLEIARHLLLTCQAYLGNDSGLTHLAALIGLPTTALFGSSDPAIWQPLGQKITILHKPRLEQIEIGQVLASLAWYTV